jgi:hypothetical protein
MIGKEKNQFQVLNKQRTSGILKKINVSWFCAIYRLGDMRRGNGCQKYVCEECTAVDVNFCWWFVCPDCSDD